MVKPIASFPYLKISQEFNLDYGDVLILADYYTCGRGYNESYAIDAYNRVKFALDSLSRDGYHLGKFVAQMANARDNFLQMQKEGMD